MDAVEKSFRIDLRAFMALILKFDFITSRGRSNIDSSSSRGNSISTEVVIVVVVASVVVVIVVVVAENKTTLHD